ncbi:hypothetical protein EVAR_97186_1 [Eumeta japonica]|uniref:Uncharacterized protein n=1 Tax=Eumeta variegata TaxID=151549 RepID=A0A4C1WFH5_EUMVA|nr:hypothetical protein EVAR_97186_1 [Eumeta japonica]
MPVLDIIAVLGQASLVTPNRCLEEVVLVDIFIRMTSETVTLSVMSKQSECEASRAAEEPIFLDRLVEVLSIAHSGEGGAVILRMKASEQSDDGASAPAGGATEAMQVDDVIASVSILDCINVDLVRTPIIKDTFISS